MSQPIGECCATGHIHTGEAKGKIETILDVETYIATPSADKANGNVLLYFPDAWGHYQNNFLIMDTFAAAGFVVLGPDYFRGDPVWKYRKHSGDPNSKDDPNFDIAAWAGKHRKFADPWVPKFVDEIKARYSDKPDTKFVTAGYCFGGPYVCDQLSEKGICVAGAFAHPASLEDRHFTDLKNPLFLSCSEVDFTFPKEYRRRAVDLLDEHKKVYQLQLFQGVSHGFATRSDLDNPWEKYVKEASFQGMLEWFWLWTK